MLFIWRADLLRPDEPVLPGGAATASCTKILPKALSSEIACLGGGAWEDVKVGLGGVGGITSGNGASLDSITNSDKSFSLMTWLLLILSSLTKGLLPLTVGMELIKTPSTVLRLLTLLLL